MSTVQQLIKTLQSHDPEEGIACILWTRSDVIETAKDEHEIELSNDLADEVLHRMDKYSDCEYGITWETLKQTLMNVLDEEKIALDSIS